MSDFETHPVGTRFIMESYLEEIKLSRALARAIEQEVESYGQVVPHAVMKRYFELKRFYEKQIGEGIQ